MTTPKWYRVSYETFVLADDYGEADEVAHRIEEPGFLIEEVPEADVDKFDQELAREDYNDRETIKPRPLV